MTMQKAPELPISSPAASEATKHNVRPRNAPRVLFEGAIVKRAIKEAFVKLDPRVVAKNPVMMTVEVGSAITTYFWVRGVVTGASDTLFVGQVSLWLWFTVLFANFAEAMAEGRGKAQAEALRKTNGLAFSFLRSDADPVRAARDLGEAIEVLVTRPLIEQALAEATARFGETNDEALFVEQQRLTREKQDVERRLMDLMQPDAG